MGACPGWYPLLQEVELLHAPPWEILKHGIYWRDKAHKKVQAEHEARKQIAALQQGGYY